MFKYVIGDIHGSVMNAAEFPDGAIQVGDFNLAGYTNWKPGRTVYFIDGNHDHFPSIDTNAPSPYEIQSGLYYIPRGFCIDDTLFIGGAESIDKNLRTPGYDWFPEETLTQQQFERAMNQTASTIISHTCPKTVKDILIGKYITFPTETALETIWKKIRPKLWIFGHFHNYFDRVIEGTRFICAPQNSIVEIPKI